VSIPYTTRKSSVCVTSIFFQHGCFLEVCVPRVRLPDGSLRLVYIYLPATIRGQYFCLYPLMDVFSSKIVDWQAYAEERSAQISESSRTGSVAIRSS
jgi:hypothetical protein